MTLKEAGIILVGFIFVVGAITCLWSVGYVVTLFVDLLIGGLS